MPASISLQDGLIARALLELLLYKWLFPRDDHPPFCDEPFHASTELSSTHRTGLMSHAGELAGVGASLVWAMGTLIFSRIPARASALNLYKSTLAALVLGLAACGSMLIEARAPEWSAKPLLFLAASSFIGIVLGDTAYYRSLQILGPRRALVLTTLAPPASALLAWLARGEVLTGRAWTGMTVTLFGVVCVLADRAADGTSPRYPGKKSHGILFGALGALGQAAGMVLSKEGMQGGFQALDAAAFRLAAAAAAALVLALGAGQLRSHWETLRSGILVAVTLGTVVGTCVGMWLSLLACKLTTVAVATTLTSLTPIFVLPLAWCFFGQRPGVLGWIGALAAVLGVAILFGNGAGG